MKYLIDPWSMLRIVFWLLVIGMAIGILLGARV